METTRSLDILAVAAQGESDASLSPLTLVVALFLTGIGAWGVIKWRSFWGSRNDSRVAHRVKERSGPGGPLAVMFPFSFLPMLLVGLSIIAGYVGQNVTGPIGATSKLIGETLLLPWILGAFISASLVLFNRPRSLSPPAARHYKGLWGDWFYSLVHRGHRR